MIVPGIAPMYVRRWPRISASSRTPPTDMRTNLRPSARAIDWPSDVLPTPGGPTKQRICPETSLRSFATARYSMIRSFTFSRSKWSSSSTFARVVEVEVVLGERAPRQRQDPLEVGADDAVLGRGRRQALEPRRARARRPCARRRGASARRVARASSLTSACSGSPSPSSSWIALSCWRRKYSRCPFSISDCTCDWIFEPSSKTSTSRERIAEIWRSRCSTSTVSRMLLALLGRDRAQRRRDEVRERARVVDVRRGELKLLGQVRREADDLREQALHVARQRLDLGRVVVLVRERPRARRRGTGRRRRGSAMPDAMEAADEDAQRPVGDADHLVDRSRPCRSRRCRSSRAPRPTSPSR